MKKKFILITFISILVLFPQKKVNAGTTMWMQCDYGDNCRAMSSDNCQEEWNLFVTVTSNNGVKNIAYRNWADSGNLISEPKYDFDTYRNLTSCWFVEFKDIKESCDKNFQFFGNTTQLREGICPAGIRTRNGIHLNYDKVLAGVSSPKFSKSIDSPEYIFYEYTSPSDSGDKKHIVAEAYTTEGLYATIGVGRYDMGAWDQTHSPSSGAKMVLAIMEDHQLNTIKSQKASFFEVSSNFETLIIADPIKQKNARYNYCKTKEECESKYNFKIIIDSKDSNGRLKATVDKWYTDDVQSRLASLNKELSIIENNNQLINSSEKLNNLMKDGKKYDFPSTYSASKMISDLNNAFELLDALYENENLSFIAYDENLNEKETDDPLKSAYSYTLKELFGNPNLEKIAEPYDYYNIGHINSMVTNDIERIIESKSDIEFDIKGKIDNYLLTFFTSVSYLDDNADTYKLSAEDRKLLEDIRKKYEELAGSRDIYVITDCKSLLGSDLLDKINSYVNIIKIAIPIILIGFGIFDFASAVFAGEEDKMKKSQQQFLKRVGIAILIYFIPTIVSLILKLANEVWSYISPDTCGIFEVRR